MVMTAVLAACVLRVYKSGRIHYGLCNAPCGALVIQGCSSVFAASSGPEEPCLSITKLKANRRLRPHTIILNDDVLVRIDPEVQSPMACSSCYLRCLDWHIELFADALRPEVSAIDKIPDINTLQLDQNFPSPDKLCLTLESPRDSAGSSDPRSARSGKMPASRILCLEHGGSFLTSRPHSSVIPPVGFG